MKFRLPFLRDEAEVPGFEKLVLDFESLGHNCEFGLVQRYVGAEPLGLLRFAANTIPNLIHALDTDLAEYGAQGDLLIEPGALGYLFCRSRRYGFVYNTGDLTAKSDAEAVLAREYKKIAYLKNRFLSDLADGEKIFVRKGMRGETYEEVVPLVAALRRHGPVTVLRVVEAGDGRAAGDVAWRAEGVMEGAIERFAPDEQATELALEGWLDLCRNAWALARGTTAPVLAAPTNLLAGEGSAAQPHVATEHDGVVARRQARKLRAGVVLTFSAWIWLPLDFDGDRVAVEFGRLRLGHRDADLTQRGVWQRIWTAARLDKGVSDAELRLMHQGPPGGRFWSTGWRLEEGPVPAAAIGPTVNPADA